MGFTRCVEVFDGRGGSFGDDMNRRWVRRFEVVTDTRTMGPLAVLYCPGLPAMFSPYQAPGGEFDNLSLLRKYDPRCDDDNPFLWYVDCEYSTLPVTGNAQAGQPAGGAGDPGSAGGAGSGASANPDLELPVWDWDFEEIQFAPPKDISNPPRAFVNSAADPFDPPPTVKTGYRVLNYSRNELTADRCDGSWDFVVNSGAFLGWAAGEVLCLPPKASRVWRGTLGYYRVKYTFKFVPSNLPAWNPLQLLDQGFATRAAGVRTPIRDGMELVAREQLLDGRGGRLAAGAKPVYREFTVYPVNDLNDLGITL